MQLTKEELFIVWCSIQHNYEVLRTLVEPPHGYKLDKATQYFPDFDETVNELIEGLLILQPFIETKDSKELIFYIGGEK